MSKTTLMTIAKQVKTEADAYAYLESLRWPDGPVCPHCGNAGKHYFLTPKTGTGARKTRTGAETQRRVWKCSKCRKQFSVITNTVFHGTKVPLHTWLMVVFEMCSNKNGIAAREIERKYGVAPKTAWFMTHRLREAMSKRAPEHLFNGTVVMDETWIGGEPRFRHGYKKVTRGQGKIDPDRKTAVVSLVDRDSGEVRSRVVPEVTGENLSAVLRENVEPHLTTLHTDEAKTYRSFSHRFAGHETVNHLEREYVRGDVSTNQAENYFSQLKRSLDGTYHHVSREHLQRYLTEFDFRYSTRELTDAQRMQRLIGRSGGKRLLYKPAVE
jgi:transposase-like protein